MEKRLDEISENLVEIKTDLKYHIKRTNELEQMVTPTYRLYIFASYLVKALVPMSIIIGIWYKMS